MAIYGTPGTDPKAGKSSGADRVEDGTVEADKGLDEQPAPGRGVFMTPQAFQLIHERLLLQDGFTPEEIVEFIAQAMDETSVSDLYMTESGPIPSLVNRGLIDSVTGLRYDVRILLERRDGGFNILTLIQEGLPPRKTG